ncbi:MAG: hypothetical protein R6X02_09060 [Enhygromyxa sp.]
MIDDQEFLRRFESAELSSEEFGHPEHVRMAWLYLRAHPLPEALARICGGIQRFAEAHGADGLYHETITVGYALLICGRLGDAGEDWLGFRRRNPELFEGGLGLLRRYYQEGTLQSSRAKQRFVWPDRIDGEALDELLEAQKEGDPQTRPTPSEKAESLTDGITPPTMQDAQGTVDTLSGKQCDELIGVGNSQSGDAIIFAVMRSGEEWFRFYIDVGVFFFEPSESLTESGDLGDDDQVLDLLRGRGSATIRTICFRDGVLEIALVGRGVVRFTEDIETSLMTVS